MYLATLGTTREQQAEALGVATRTLTNLIKRRPKYPPEYYQALAADAASQN